MYYIRNSAMAKQRKSKKAENTESSAKSISTKKKSSSIKKKKESEEQITKKKKSHSEKVIKKQEERLPQHIERIKKKEAKGQPANKERFYVTNAKLLEELYKWRDSGPAPKEGEKETRQVSEEFGKMIMMIADRLTNHSNFKNYPYDMKQEMKSYAQFKIMQGLHNYNFKYKNAFAYFTTACYNAFISTINAYYKKKNFEREYAKRSLEKLESTAEINSSKILNQFIRDYLGEDFLEETKKDDGTK